MAAQGKRWYKNPAVQASIVSGIFLIIGAVTTQLFKTEHQPRGQIEITDVIIWEGYQELGSDKVPYEEWEKIGRVRFARVDFRVLNRGNATSTISRVRFEAINAWSQSYRGGLPPSGGYRFVNLSNLKQPGDTVEITVSHSLNTNEADRFIVDLIATEIGMGDYITWKLKPVLVTSEGSVESDPIIIHLPGKPPAPYEKGRILW